MAYADLATIQATDPGDILTAAWCDQARDNEEFLIDPPACSVRRSSSELTVSGTISTLTPDTETFDNDSMHSTVTNPSRITIQTPGRYLIFALVRFAAHATGGRHLSVRVNGATIHDLTSVAAHQSSFDSFLSGAKSFVFAAGDYLEVRATQHSGGNLAQTVEDFTAVFITR